MSEQQFTNPAVVVPPGRSVRFAVAATNGARSATWMVWTSKNNDDVYVAARSMAGTWKVSLHQSGSWQYGFISDEKATAAGWMPVRPTRHMDIWARPADRGPGLVRACSIVIPWSELRIPPPSWVESKPYVRIADPKAGHAALIEIAIVEATSPINSIRFPEPIVYVACLARAGGGRVDVVARRKAWSEPNQSVLDAEKQRLVKSGIPDFGTDAMFVRVTLTSEEPDGSRRFLEAAADVRVTPDSETGSSVGEP